MRHVLAEYEGLTEKIIGCAIRVHETFGPGLLESVYKACLVVELEAAGLRVETARKIRLTYRGKPLDCVYCPDLIVNETVLIELKAVESLSAVHTAQVITYLKLTNLPIGLLINFNVSLLNRGVRHVVRPDLYTKRSALEEH